MFTVIVKVVDGRIAIFQEFDNIEDAEAHLETVSDEFPDAFIYNGPYSPDLFIEDGNVVTTKPLLTDEQVWDGLALHVEGHLDTEAQRWGFKTMVAATTYAEETSVPAYHHLGRELRKWRSACWLVYDVTKEDADEGTIPIPTPPELIAMLPPFTPPPGAQPKPGKK